MFVKIPVISKGKLVPAPALTGGSRFTKHHGAGGAG